MANLARFNVIDNTLDELMRGFFVRPVNFETAPAPLQLRVDVSENEAGYTVHAEIPGVKKDDIHVAIDGNQVEISAEVQEREGSQGRRTCAAHPNATTASSTARLRSVRTIDEAATEARYADGVLELTLPKKAAAKAKRITIQ